MATLSDLWYSSQSENICPITAQCGRGLSKFEIVTSKNFDLATLEASAPPQGSICHNYQVSGTTTSSSICKNVKFLGLNSIILLSKIKERAPRSTHFSLISQVSMDIFEVFYEEFLFPNSPRKKL